MGEWFKNLFSSLEKLFIEGEEVTFSTLEKILISIAIIIIGWIVIKILGSLLKKVFGIKKGPNIDVSAKSFIVSCLKFFMWLFIAFLVISVLGIDVTGIVGVLSAVTVALGLALQDLIGDFAAGVILLNQKCFVTNDYIEVSNGYGKVEGSVVKIGLVSSSLKTVNGQMVYVSNSNMRKANVTNYTKEKLRRIVFNVNVSYDSDIEKAKTLLNEIAMNDEKVNKDIAPYVFVSELGSYYVAITLRMYTDYQVYWDVYNALFEKTLIAFRDNNIKIPSSIERYIGK